MFWVLRLAIYLNSPDFTIYSHIFFHSIFQDRHAGTEIPGPAHDIHHGIHDIQGKMLLEWCEVLNFFDKLLSIIIFPISVGLIGALMKIDHIAVLTEADLEKNDIGDIRVNNLSDC